MNVSASIQMFPPKLKAQLIASALPFMQRYEGQSIAIKFGGSAMDNPDLAQAFACDIALLQQAGIRPIVIHGGGPQIGKMLDRLGIESEFRDGLRVTSAEAVEVVEMVLAGTINKQIVASINAEGETAVGLSGKDGGLVRAEPLRREACEPGAGNGRILDLGFVGTPASVNPKLLEVMAQSSIIPVVAPIAQCEKGQTYNINADTFAGAIAGSLKARRLLFLTDVPGVLDANGQVINQLSTTRARAMIASGEISGGMIPKVEICIEAVSRGVEGVVILDGKTLHAVLLELFTDGGVGTLITADQEDDCAFEHPNGASAYPMVGVVER